MTSSNGPTGVHPLDDLAAYAVNALDDIEQEAVADHLTLCRACRDDLAAHHETLALLSPQQAPPAAVWQRVAAGIGAPGLPDPHATPHEQSSPARPAASDDDDVVRPPPAPTRLVPVPVEKRPPFRLGWMAAAATVAVALAAGAIAGYALGRSGDPDDADIASLAQQASEHPGGELATLVSSDGEAVAHIVADEDGAYLVLSGMESLPTGRAYQLWSLTEPQPVSLGMLGRDGTNTVAFRLPPTVTDLAISEAPTNGDATPTGQFLASGTITPT